VIPAELSFYDRYVWFQQRVYRNAAALIKDHPAHDVQLGDEPIERGPSPEAQLLEAGRASDFVALLGEGNAPALSEVMSKLTPRERQVFLSYLDGLSTAEIASDLGIAHSTVRVHRRNAHRKLDPQADSI
jgi:RNA polymerase sigma factor (sigma-70 family)